MHCQSVFKKMNRLNRNEENIVAVVEFMESNDIKYYKLKENKSTKNITKSIFIKLAFVRTWSFESWFLIRIKKKPLHCYIRDKRS